MNILISGATGFVGQNLANHLKEHHNIYALGRDKIKIKNIFPSLDSNAIHYITWQELNSYNAQDFDVIINLAGETINHLFWSTKTKINILNSRVETTKTLVDWCSKAINKELHFLNASAISIYGLYDKKTRLSNTENTIIQPHDDFLSKIAFAWEEEVKKLKDCNIDYTLLRFAVILGKNGGALNKLLAPAKFGLAARLGNGQQPFAWIVIEDLIRAIDFIITKRLLGPINMVAPEITTQDEFYSELSKSLNKPYFLKIPAIIIKLFLRKMGQELLIKGQNAAPEVLITNGFLFKFNHLTELVKYIKE